MKEDLTFSSHGLSQCSEWTTRVDKYEPASGVWAYTCTPSYKNVSKYAFIDHMIQLNNSHSTYYYNCITNSISETSIKSVIEKLITNHRNLTWQYSHFGTLRNKMEPWGFKMKPFKTLQNFSYVYSIEPVFFNQNPQKPYGTFLHSIEPLGYIIRVPCRTLQNFYV